MFIDGVIRGYDYGMPLSDTMFDSMVQKGDKDIKDIYSVLSWEFPQFVSKGCIWLNWEEDVGSTGLREAKTSYKPAFMLKKFIVREVADNE